MAEEYVAICKDCFKEFGYSEASLQSGSMRGLSRPERCPACRRIHSKEGRSIGIPQIKVKSTGPRKPDSELTPGRLGKIFHPERPHKKVTVEGKFGRPDSRIEFGITDDDIRLLISTMQNYQVSVVVGPTGSGKSTFLPYRLMVPPEGIEPDIFTQYGQIVVTQPRIQATRNIAQFVSKDLHGCSLGAGFDVGFRHSNAPASDWRNKLVYITDGTLINWIVTGQISNLSVIMIDEAHERSLNIDLILGLLKKQLPRFTHLKLIIASATINAKLFQDYFGGPEKVGMLQFRGLKQHRVDAHFPDHDYMLKNDRDVPVHMARKILDILLAIARRKKEEGDILAFLPGEGPIETCVTRLRQMVLEQPELRERGINIYPLYTRLPQDLQDLALARKTQVICDKIMAALTGGALIGQDKIMGLLLDHKAAVEASELVQKAMEKAGITDWVITILKLGERDFDVFPRQIIFATHETFAGLKNAPSYHIITDQRVIVSTNVAETSLTVDGIVYVVDSGLIKESRWDGKHSADDLVPIFHSRAGCRQRWGRAGRVRNGEAHMLYTDVQFEDHEVFSPYTTPEIKRVSLEQVVLKAKAAGIDNLDDFEWIESPAQEELDRVPRVLKGIGALDEDGDLTNYGIELGSFSTDLPIANLLVNADQYACGLEMATLAAIYPLQIKGSLFSWNRGWNFSTRNRVEQIIAGLSRSCRDDLDFYLKIYSVWAEAGTEEERSYFCRLFFINEEQLFNKIIPARNQFLEMLSIGKKSEEDRPINFGLLDRLRIVLATSLPDEFIYRTENGSNFRNPFDTKPLQDIDEGEVEIEIDEDSVLAQTPPPLFLALRRRIARGKDGRRQLRLSGLTSLEPEWVRFRNRSSIQLGSEISRIISSKVAAGTLGVERHRLFLDVKFPIGARYVKMKDENGNPVPAGKTDNPRLFEPVIADERFGGTEETPVGSDRDVDPLAGWKDKEDSQVPYDPVEETSLPTQPPETDEWLNGDDLKTETERISNTDGTGLKIGFIETDETKTAMKMIPIFRWNGPDTGADRCDVIGHDFSNLTMSTVILRDCPRESESLDKNGALIPGTLVKVKATGVLENSKGEKALRVREEKTQAEFIIDSENLTFSGRWCFVGEFQGKDFSMIVEERANGRVELSCLPLAEKHLHGLLKSLKGPINSKLIEKRGKDLYFLLGDAGSPFPDGIVHGAFMKIGREVRTTYNIGQFYPLVIDARAFDAWIPVPSPPDGLLDFIEKEKFRLSIFWNKQRLRLHCKEPMTRETKEQLLSLSEDPDYLWRIKRLYRYSNSITVQPVKPESTGHRSLETGKSRKEAYFHKEIPVYKAGEKIKGTISRINNDKVSVVLETGGTGTLPLVHLSWKKLIDPREVVYADQEIFPRVMSQEGNKIKLTLLDPDDSPAKKYRVGSIRQAVIYLVENKFALAELEKGIMGFIPPYAVREEPVENLHDHLETGQKVDVKIMKVKVDLCDSDSPLKIILSMRKDVFGRARIPVPKIRALIGKGGSSIKELREKTRCSIQCYDNGNVEIKGPDEGAINLVVRLIKERIPEMEIISIY